MVPADLRADAHFVGFVPGPERGSYYASGDLLLCPAVGGTFGIIVLEAMAAGCAVVAADTPGFRNVMRDGVEGHLVDVSADPGVDRARALREPAAGRRSRAAPLRGGRPSNGGALRLAGRHRPGARPLRSAPRRWERASVDGAVRVKASSWPRTARSARSESWLTWARWAACSRLCCSCLRSPGRAPGRAPARAPGPRDGRAVSRWTIRPEPDGCASCLRLIAGRICRVRGLPRRHLRGAELASGGCGSNG